MLPLFLVLLKPIWDYLIPEAVKNFILDIYSRFFRKRKGPKGHSSCSCPHNTGVTNILSKDQFDQIKTKDPLVVVKFTAEWCGPCKTISPVYESLSTENSSIRFLEVDIEECDDLALSLGVSSIPAFHAYSDGELLDNFVGADVNKLMTLITKLNSLSSNKRD